MGYLNFYLKFSLNSWAVPPLFYLTNFHFLKERNLIIHFGYRDRAV